MRWLKTNLSSLFPMHDFRELLPPWAYSEEVARLADNEFRDKEVPMRCVTGPTLKWVLLYGPPPDDIVNRICTRNERIIPEAW